MEPPPECALPATKRVPPATPPPLPFPMEPPPESALPATKSVPPAAPPRLQAADEEDRLSALDDGILHVILARVPLRDAAATTVLSRRWRRVFATLPRLHIRAATFNRRGFPDGGDEDYCEDPWRWMDALSCVLDSRAVPVASFDINLKYMRLYSDYFAGVFADLCGSGGLRELHIVNVKFGESYHLPAPIYRCATLTSLYLYMWRLKVPGRITGLRALRLLRLHNVTATDDELRRLITRCSSLEHLEIFDLHKARNIVISAPRLEKLDIYSHRPLRVSVNNAPRLDAVSLAFSYSYPEHSWSPDDTMDSDVEYSFSEIDEMLDFEKMAKREHKRTDEIGNMVTFLSGIGCAKKLHLCPKIPEVLSTRKVFMPKVLPNRRCLFGLEKLNLGLDHNHEVFATLVSCLLNSSPNLKDLIITDSRYSRTRHVPLPMEYWKEHIDANGVLSHLSSVTFFIDWILEGHPCRGFCQFLVMNARVLKKISIMYYRWQVKPEDAAKLEAIQREIQLWPRASPDLQLELCRLNHYEGFNLDSD